MSNTNTSEYTVIAISKNTNAFGYRSVLVCNDNGSAYQLLNSAYTGFTFPKKGDKITNLDSYVYKYQLPSCTGLDQREVKDVLYHAGR